MLTDAPPWMWGIGLLGLALVLGSIAFALYEAAAGDSSPPDVTVRVDSILPTRNGYLVEFRAVNEGGSTAEGLTIEGELKNGAESVETSDTTIEYVPSHSERGGGLFFTSDPRRYELRLRAKGYEKP
ncbi:MAG TPA: TIGR02588 family protein [Pyrinomonadaceae bacterium]